MRAWKVVGWVVLVAWIAASVLVTIVAVRCIGHGNWLCAFNGGCLALLGWIYLGQFIRRSRQRPPSSAT